MSNGPSIFEYLNYRLYIDDKVSHLRTTPGFNLKDFCKETGMGSTSYIRMLVDGKRNLSRLVLRKLAHGFHLDIEEIRFFEMLVNFNHAVTTAEKDAAFRKLLTSKRFRKIKRLEAAQFEFFSDILIVVLLEALGSPSWKKLSPSQMARSLSISTEEVQKKLRVLETLGLIRNENSIWQRQDAAFATPAEMQSLQVRNYHRQMIQKGLEAVDESLVQDRELQAVTMSLSRSQYIQLKKQIADFCDAAAAEFLEESNPEKIYQLNVQLFPVLDLNSGSEKTKDSSTK